MAELFAFHALGSAAQHRRTYYLRAISPFLVLPMAAVVALTIWTDSRDYFGAANDLGRFMMSIVIIDHGLLVLGITPLFAAIQFSKEARDKTLSILVLATPSLIELYAYKFIRATMHSYGQLIATIPIAIVGTYLAGIDMHRMIGYLVCVAAAITVVAAAGLIASLFSLTPAASVAGVYVLMMAVLIPSYAVHFFVDPAFPAAFWSIADTLNMGLPEIAVVPTVAYYLGLSMLLAVVTIYCIPLRVRMSPKARRKASKPSSYRWAPSVSERFFLSGPRPRWGYGSGFVTAAVTAIAFVPIALVPVLGTIVVALAVIYDVALRFDGARNAGEFEEIALTSLKDDELTRAFHRANVRASIVYLPGFIAGAVAFPLVWGTGISAAGLSDMIPMTTTAAQWAMMVLVLLLATVFGAAKYLLATSVAVRVSMMKLPFVSRCVVAVIIYLGLLAAASAMSAFLPIAFAIYDQLVTKGIPSPSLAIIHTLLATPVAAVLVIAASFAVASETRTHQPWSRDYSFNR